MVFNNYQCIFIQNLMKIYRQNIKKKMFDYKKVHFFSFSYKLGYFNIFYLAI